MWPGFQTCLAFLRGLVVRARSLPLLVVALPGQHAWLPSEATQAPGLLVLCGFCCNQLPKQTLLSELAIPNGPRSRPVTQEQEEEGEGSEEEWEQVGPRNKTSVTRQADFVQTPITCIFGGHIRFVLFGDSGSGRCCFGRG